MPQPPSSAIVPGAVVGGLRLVRKLGDARAAQVFLGFGQGDDPPDTAAVKVYAADRRDRAEAEIQALARAQGEHVVRLRDLADAPGGGTAIILDRLELGSLAELLDARSVLTPGEAVTILVPLAQTVDQLHVSGVSHGSVSPLRVMFRADGSPVLTGFGTASLHEPGLTAARLAQLAAVCDDRAALAVLVRLVLERVGGGEALPILDWIDRAEQGGFADPFGEELADRLFDAAVPQPVRFDRAAVGRPASHAVPARVGASISGEPPAEGTAEIRSRPAWLSGIHLPEWIENAARESLDESPAAQLRADGLARIRRSLAGVRRPVWVVAGAVAAALVVALVVVPESAGESGASVPRPEVTETPIADAPPGPVEGDDPVAALVVLLDERSRCVRDLSVLCLDGVLQAGSTAMTRDAALISDVQSGAEISEESTIVAHSPILIERLGDSALVSLGEVPESQPASTLLMKGEAGWRIRGYLD